MRIPLASSGLREQDILEINRVLNSGNLTMGAEVKKFEQRMCDYLKVEHFVMVNSGSSANLLIIEALLRPTKGKAKLNPGDSVLVPAIAWPTTIWPIIQLGLNPIFVDVEESTLAIDLQKAQTLIDNTGIPVSAIFPIHPLGYGISHTELTRFAERNELILINDVCESLGSWNENTHAGICGLASSFSFYFSHHITTMEGGGIATNNLDFANDLRSMRSHGWSRDRLDAEDWTKNISDNDSKFLFVSTGYNVRPMEIQAAIGSSQIMQLDDFVEKRRYIAERVSQALHNSSLKVIGSSSLANPSQRKGNSWMLIPILVTGDDAKRRKHEIVRDLQTLEIETRPVLTGNFLAQPAIQRITRHSVDPKNFVVAQKITEQAFMVGAHHDLSNEQIDFLCERLKEVTK